MRINNTITKMIFCAITATNMLFISCSVFAENAPTSSMFVSPLIEKITLNTGEHYEGSIKVANAGTSTEDLKYYVEVGSYGRSEDATSKDDYGNIDVDTRTQYNMIMDWITIDKKSGVVPPNTTDVVTYSIDVPADTPAGAQYASLLVTNNNDDDEGTGNITIKNKMRIASAIIANISGENIEKGSIIENYIPQFITVSPLETTSMVRNDGNVYTDAEYTLQVWPLFSNEEICTNEENPDTNLVLPDTKRYHSQSCDLPIVGIFRAKQVVKIFGETSIAEKTIIVCPIWLLFVIIFIIAAIIIYIIAKARKHKIKKETA